LLYAEGQRSVLVVPQQQAVLFVLYGPFLDQIVLGKGGTTRNIIMGGTLFLFL
jgi:hypothetical protein